MFCVNFSCRAFDAGNRRIRGLSEKILKKARPGDIILLHDVNPGTGFDAGDWIREIETILIGLKNKELEILPLPDVIGRPVMRRTASRSGASRIRPRPFITASRGPMTQNEAARSPELPPEKKMNYSSRIF